MKIVIELDDTFYNILCLGKKAKKTKLTDGAVDILFKAVLNGTPLPEHHGRLIYEPTKEEIEKTVGGQSDFAECIRDSVKAVFDNAPTIIEESESE